MAEGIDNLDDHIAIVRRNIEDLTAQATGVSGAAAEERIARRLSDQQDLLNELLRLQEGRERRISGLATAQVPFATEE